MPRSQKNNSYPIVSLKVRTFHDTMFYPSNCIVPRLFCFVNSFIAELHVITSVVVRFRFISTNFFIVILMPFIFCNYLITMYLLCFSADVNSDSCKWRELFWIKLSTKNSYHFECSIQIKSCVQQIPSCL